MKYHYAINAAGQLITVQSLTPDSKGQSLACPGCGAPLLARMGEQVAWHFAHHPGTHCSPETYLHKLGKQVFANTYRHRVEAREPFWIEFYQALCREPERCGDRVLSRYDLTRYYPAVAVEQAAGGFMPDLLLSSPDRSDSIFVEIKVTHGCEPSKLASGRRIIEIALQTEDDLRAIQAGRLRESWRVSLLMGAPQYPVWSGGDVRFHNFKRQARRQTLCECRKRTLKTYGGEIA